MTTETDLLNQISLTYAEIDEYLQPFLKKEKNRDVFTKEILKKNNHRCEVLRVITRLDSRVPPKKVLEDLKGDVKGFDTDEYKSVRDELEKQDIFFSSTPEIEEGVFVCSKCKHNRILTTSKQTRGLDEGTSVFCRCVKCGNEWRES